MGIGLHGRHSRLAHRLAGMATYHTTRLNRAGYRGGMSASPKEDVSASEVYVVRVLGSVARIIEPQRRPRDRLLAGEARHMRDAELLAEALRIHSGEREPVDLARAMLTEFGGLEGLLGQSTAQLLKVRGLGQAKAASLMAMRELLSRAMLAAAQPPLARARSKRGKMLFKAAKAMRGYLAMRLLSQERETFGVVLLDVRNQLLGIEELFFGSIDRASVYPREVLKACLRYNAGGAVLYHNHPSGVPEPSETDVSITTRLMSVLNEIDVKVLDHVVVGGLAQVSMAERKMVEGLGDPDYLESD